MGSSISFRFEWAAAALSFGFLTAVVLGLI